MVSIFRKTEVNWLQLNTHFMSNISLKVYNGIYLSFNLFCTDLLSMSTSCLDAEIHVTDSFNDSLSGCPCGRQ